MKKHVHRSVLTLLLSLLLLLSSCAIPDYIQDGFPSDTTPQDTTASTDSPYAQGEIPAYSGTPFVYLNQNVPDFTSDDYTTESYEYYSELDDLGRCGVAMACIGIDLMPTEDRGSISSVKPSGWKSVQYDIVDGKYLYNRCHLIGFQLSGENANEKNLITGTRYLNVEGMLPFENMIADYVKETENHVLFRVTPLYHGNDLVAHGVQMEAFSIEDNGDGICFHVYVYNVQPGITIDYATGNSHLTGDTPESETSGTSADSTEKTDITYILNTDTKKFHFSSCSSAQSMKEENKQTYTGDREDLIAQGYSPCGKCDP